MRRACAACHRFQLGSSLVSRGRGASAVDHGSPGVCRPLARRPNVYRSNFLSGHSLMYASRARARSVTRRRCVRRGRSCPSPRSLLAGEGLGSLEKSLHMELGQSPHGVVAFEPPAAALSTWCQRSSALILPEDERPTSIIRDPQKENVWPVLR